MQTLPSDSQPAPEAGHLVLAPFRGVRYAPDRVSGIANVTSPPYDVIGPGGAERLLAAEPHNVVRLILPGSGTGQSGRETGDPSQAAARTLGDWLATGVLRADPRPALYVYEQSLPAGGRDAGPAGDGWVIVQRGLIGALRLVPPGAPSVLPHEDVMPGPVRGRRELMERTQANLEPIFLLYDPAGQAGDQAEHPAGGEAAGRGATALVDQVAGTREALVCAVTGDGVRHRLWALTDPAEHASVAADLASRSALIADGHHRYAAYLELQARKHAAGCGPGPWDYGLAFLADSAAYPPRIDAIHRVIPSLTAAQATGLAAGSVLVRPLPGGLDAALGALSRAGEPAFLVTDGAEHYLLTEPRPDRLAAAMPAGRSARWRALSASVLRELLIRVAWGLRDEEPDVLVAHGDAGGAVQAARQAGGTAVICTPVRASDVRAVAENGERMPRKSTSFGPKPRTGLVMRTFTAPGERA